MYLFVAQLEHFKIKILDLCLAIHIDLYIIYNYFLDVSICDVCTGIEIYAT